MTDFNAKFIKATNTFDATYQGDVCAPLFRKKFVLGEFSNAEIFVCGLGYGYYYVNGKSVSDDLFTAPVSSYDKLVWYNVYNVTDLLNVGENVLAIALGNGFFNENFTSHWKNHEAPFRDNPKFALQLVVDGNVVLTTDETFVCTETSFVTRNELRSGETFDATKYDANWKSLSFDDTAWHNAVTDESGFAPQRKECKCEPVRECQEYDFVSCTQTDEGYLLDFGTNFSGYIRAKIDENKGTVVTFSHAEEVDNNNKLKLNGLNILYPTVDFQVDRFVCGKPMWWSPKFTYHGFRYVLVQGLTKPPQKGSIKGVFVHQIVNNTSTFECSNSLLNKIYNAGIRAVQSNMHYALTDCPTREKFGWTNDAQASAEQICINFNVNKFLRKWLDDFESVLTPNGLPCIVPTHGNYGYNWGPVNDGAFFEIPYRFYQYTGDGSLLVDCLPCFKKYYGFYQSEDNVQDIWLGDWDGLNNRSIDMHFIKLFYTVKFCNIIALAQSLAGEDNGFYANESAVAKNGLLQYLNADGSSSINNQTATSMLLCLGIGNKRALTKQLLRCFDEYDGHLHCGMLGIQYVYDALSQNGCVEKVFDAITAEGEPSFKAWFDNGATTLWETWTDKVTDSRNHHMFSNVLAWFTKYLLGYKVTVDVSGNITTVLEPQFIKQLDYCKGSVFTQCGKLELSWERIGNKVRYVANVPDGLQISFNGKQLNSGTNTFEL